MAPPYNLRWIGLVASPYSPSLTIEVEKTLDENAENNTLMECLLCVYSLQF